MSELLDHLEQSIRARRLFRPGQPILVAVSGGVDSVVLLHLLHQLARKHRWQLMAAHFNHRLRGRSSDADERLVRRMAEGLKVPVLTEGADVRAFARGENLSLEMAARKLRHDFLARAAAQGRIPSVALAHHADDQLELFFLRLLRGSGGEGLAGMKWRNPSPSDPGIELVHPLLDQPKAVLLKYAADQGIRYREDASNAALGFQRNRIRHELLPLLRRSYQPALDKTISRVMDIIGAEAEFAAEAAREWLEQWRTGRKRAWRIEDGEWCETRREDSGGVRPSSGAAASGPPNTLGSSETPSLAEVAAPEDGRTPAVRLGCAGPSTSFNQLPVAVQRRCVQLQLLSQGIVPDFELVEQVRTVADRPVTVSRVQAQGDAKAGRAGEAPARRAARRVGRERTLRHLDALCASEPGRDAFHRVRDFAGKEWDAVERVPTRFTGGDSQRTGGTPVLRYVVRDRAGVVRLHAVQAEQFKSSAVDVELKGRAGEVEFDGARISWRIELSNTVGRPKAGIGRECFDADRVGSLVRLRHWRPGDRFQPIGMSCPVKLQDFFTNHKVPRDRRRRLIVAATAKGEVFWVEGMRISERFKLAKETIRRLQWRWKRL